VGTRLAWPQDRQVSLAVSGIVRIPLFLPHPDFGPAVDKCGAARVFATRPSSLRSQTDQSGLLAQIA